MPTPPPAPDTPYEPCRRAYSREEMIEAAKAYLRYTYGPCHESADGDGWHERFGLLVAFIHDNFPPNTGLPPPNA